MASGDWQRRAAKRARELVDSLLFWMAVAVAIYVLWELVLNRGASSG